MGKRGPIGASSRILKLTGAYRADRHATRDGAPEPARLAVLPRAPAHLGKVGRQEWRRIGPELLSLGLLTAADLTAFGLYCLAYQRAIEAEQLLTDAGALTTTTKRGVVRVHPAVQVARQAWAEVRKWGAEFGLSPSTRMRVRVPTQKPALVTDPWDEVGR